MSGQKSFVYGPLETLRRTRVDGSPLKVKSPKKSRSRKSKGKQSPSAPRKKRSKKSG